ncbi:MAG: recombinase RecT [Clostridiales bacterium]|nr:recombinase RecT [Clostridiales bacterium]
MARTAATAAPQTPSNSLAQKAKPKFSVAIQSDAYKNLINNTLNDPKRASRFIANITSAVSVNPTLQECDAATILSAGLLGEALNLSPSPQLGQFYMVPYEDKKRGCKVAQFQLGYKGYIQLAIRSGQYRKINVLPIKEGELVSFDPMTEEIEVNLIEDDELREKTPTAGYYAMFEYVNGFRKAIYWSYKKMLNHADQYSKAFSKKAYQDLKDGKIPQSDLWKYSSFWYKNFDDMACKTMLRQLISKWGIMSIEMQKALEYDQGVGIVKDGKASGVEYVDSPDADLVIEPTVAEPKAAEEDPFK